MNGYNFTDRVRKVLQMAREEAARLHHGYVGTEHILLGLIREGEGVAAAVLTNLNVDLEEIQQKIEETVKKGKAAAATPSPSRIRPSRMCSVPTYSWCSRAASSRAICRTFRTRSVKLYPFISVPGSGGLGSQQLPHVCSAHQLLFCPADRASLTRCKM